MNEDNVPSAGIPQPAQPPQPPGFPPPPPGVVSGTDLRADDRSEAKSPRPLPPRSEHAAGEIPRSDAYASLGVHGSAGDEEEAGIDWKRVAAKSQLVVAEALSVGAQLTIGGARWVKTHADKWAASARLELQG